MFFSWRKTVTLHLMLFHTLASKKVLGQHQNQQVRFIFALLLTWDMTCKNPNDSKTRKAQPWRGWEKRREV